MIKENINFHPYRQQSSAEYLVRSDAEIGGEKRKRGFFFLPTWVPFLFEIRVFIFNTFWDLYTSYN